MGIKSSGGFGFTDGLLDELGDIGTISVAGIGLGSEGVGQGKVGLGVGDAIAGVIGHQVDGFDLKIVSVGTFVGGGGFEGRIEGNFGEVGAGFEIESREDDRQADNKNDPREDFGIF